MVRRRNSGEIYDAVQYSEPDESWSPGCIGQVAAFLLGVDPDKATTVANDQMLDVVRPLFTEFDPTNGIATIEVMDREAGNLMKKVQLGIWILSRPGIPLYLVDPSRMWELFEPLPGTVHRADIDALTKFIYEDCFDTPEGSTWIRLAEHTAGKLIRAGWSRK